MKGILFTGGEAPSADIVELEILSADLIVAADSGWNNALRCNTRPGTVVGDMDSITFGREESEEFMGEDVIRYPQDKDDTDTEIGLKFLKDRGCSEIVLMGGGGGRLDHLMGILSLFDRNDLFPDRWYTAHEKIWVINQKLAVNLPVGNRVSFFPCGPETCRMKTTGLKWPLDNLEWNKGDTGISNIVLDSPVSIEVKTGRLMMVYEFDQKEES